MVNRLLDLVHSGELSVFCARTLREMESFVFDDAGKRAEAATGSWDDMVMALAGACVIGDRRRGGGVEYARVSDGFVTSGGVGW
jgi:hypothetical protein